MQKSEIAEIVFLVACSLCLLFCGWVNLFGWSNGFVSSAGDILVGVLARLNLMDYRPHIGGHGAHIHGLVFVANLLIAVIYSEAIAYTACKKMKLHLKRVNLLNIVVFVTSFAIHIVITYSFLFELERFGYIFFVPQV
ncbi:MAG: hypothetical protein FWE24_02825 [Defluviitaleaceae bacterium]|nr:hypothetical protein [Defluviitaleaceae bacterium]